MTSARSKMIECIRHLSPSGSCLRHHALQVCDGPLQSWLADVLVAPNVDQAAGKFIHNGEMLE